MPPEKTAGIVNGLLVLGLVLVLTIAGSMSGASVVVYADPVRHVVRTVAGWFLILMLFTPLAAVVAWRTWAHARRAIVGDGSGWAGVAEGGCIGALVALPFVAPAIVLPFVRPRTGIPVIQSLMYAGIYLLLGLVVGLLVAFMLRMTALLVLRATTRPGASR